MFNITMRGDANLLAKLDSLPTAVRAALEAKVIVLANDLRNHIQADKLQGQVLQQRTGALSASITAEAPISTGTSVKGRVYSAGDVKYAAIHEFGGLIPAHDVVPKAAQALRFEVDGQVVFAARAHIPEVRMPERSFMRSALADLAPEIEAGLKGAVISGIKAELNR